MRGVHDTEGEKALGCRPIIEQRGDLATIRELNWMKFGYSSMLMIAGVCDQPHAQNVVDGWLGTQST